MKKKDYNWWMDPSNKEQVERISWWNYKENKDIFSLPFSIISDGEHWTASTNDDTKKILGDRLFGCASGKTKEEAIEQMFDIIKFTHEYSEDCRLRYQRWVPFRKGPWKSIGGRWFTIFGFHFSFRYGKNMKGGWYIPFTKLNISFYSEWTGYKRWKKEQKLKHG